MSAGRWVGTLVGAFGGAAALSGLASTGVIGHLVVFAVAAAVGIGLAYAFARRERDVALPMEWAAVVAGFAGAFLVAGGLFVVVVLVAMAFGRTGA